jgi:hypothetical protein
MCHDWRVGASALPLCRSSQAYERSWPVLVLPRSMPSDDRAATSTTSTPGAAGEPGGPSSHPVGQCRPIRWRNDAMAGITPGWRQSWKMIGTLAGPARWSADRPCCRAERISSVPRQTLLILGSAPCSTPSAFTLRLEAKRSGRRARGRTGVIRGSRAARHDTQSGETHGLHPDGTPAEIARSFYDLLFALFRAPVRR